MEAKGFPRRIPADALSAAEAGRLGLDAPLPPEASDEEEDARWACLPFLKLAIERLCIMQLLAEDHEVAFSPLGGDGLVAIRAMAASAADPVFAQAAAAYLGSLATLASMMGRGETGLHQSISGLYL
ncbi:hypothetical protein HA051_16160 [Chromobacterium vaccinii]|nr:hypothetical protein [Chromobacterium vaccinii]